MRYFSRINVKDAKDIARNWISTELNPVEGENMWHNQIPSIEAQQSDPLVLQITLQEVISMIDSTAQKETIGDDVRHEETIGDDVRREEMMMDEMQQWFDWVV